MVKNLLDYDIEDNQLMHCKALKNTCCALFFSTPNNTSSWDIFHIKNNQLIILFIIYLIHIIIFNFSVYKCLMKKSSS